MRDLHQPESTKRVYSKQHDSVTGENNDDINDAQNKDDEDDDLYLMMMMMLTRSLCAIYPKNIHSQVLGICRNSWTICIKMIR